MHYILSPAHIRAYALAFPITALAFICDAWSADEVHTTMRRVEAALVAAGYEGAAGYSRLPAPPVEDVDELAGDAWGNYRVATGRIELSRRQPIGCRRVTLFHEVGHDIAIRKGLIFTVPNEQVKAELERIASIAEAAADADEFAPNCLMKGRSL